MDPTHVYLIKTSKAYKLYGTEEIHERHRHRYEVNNDYRDALTANGMKLIWSLTGRTYCRDDRDSGTSLVCRNTGTSGIKVQTEQTTSVIPWLRRSSFKISG